MQHSDCNSPLADMLSPFNNTWTIGHGHGFNILNMDACPCLKYLVRIHLILLSVG